MFQDLQVFDTRRYLRLDLLAVSVGIRLWLGFIFDGKTLPKIG